MYYIFLKLILLLFLAFPVPLVSWYVIIDFLFESLALLWLTPFMLMGCLAAPYSGYLLVRRDLTTKQRRFGLATYAVVLTVMMFMLTVLKRPVERAIELWM